jgi:hypothetical protein
MRRPVSAGESAVQHEFQWQYELRGSVLSMATGSVAHLSRNGDRAMTVFS